MWSSRGSSDPRGVSVRARLWTSSMLRTIQTAALIPHPVLRLPDGGNWESMSPRVYRNIDEIFAVRFFLFSFVRAIGLTPCFVCLFTGGLRRDDPGRGGRGAPAGDDFT